ncbi:MAG TPA: ABC transporter permease [Acidimicrobiales bacterium]|nr:ABC transporter permease [Acidimicrobiales bacterium]
MANRTGVRSAAVLSEAGALTYVNALITGVVAGSVYALVAVGVSLIFATTGVLNFAHAGFAMAAAYLYSWLGSEQGLNAWLAAALSVAAVGGLGLVTERFLIRRVADASATTRLIATLGLLALLQGLMLQLFGFQPKAARPLFTTGAISIGSIRVTSQQVAVFVTAVVLVVGLGAFLRYSRTGLAIRATAQDRDVAELMGIRRVYIARLNWGVAAFLAGVAGVLIAPLTIVTIGTFPILLIKALAATLFGGMVGLLGSFVGGFAIGSVEALASTASSVPGIRELVVLVMIVALLLARRSWPAALTSGQGLGGGALGSRLSTPARALVGVLALLAVYNAATTDFWGYIGAVGLVYVLVGFSLVVLTGWTGQVSLMHGGLAGLGAFGLTYFLDFGWPMWLAILATAVTGMVVGGIVALPALRLRGLQVGIATLAVTGALSSWLFQLEGTSWTIARPSYFVSDRNIFLVMLAITVVVALALTNLRRSAWGRTFFAVRQSGETAAHFAVDPVRVRVSAFLLSGFLAALAGAFYAVLLTAIKPTDFGPLLSITFLLYLVVGGTESLIGPVIAALLFAFGPQVVLSSQTSASAIPDIVSGVLVLLLVAGRPTGLASFLASPAQAGGGVVEPRGARVVRPRMLPTPEPGRRLPRPAASTAAANGVAARVR